MCVFIVSFGKSRNLLFRLVPLLNHGKYVLHLCTCLSDKLYLHNDTKKRYLSHRQNLQTKNQSVHPCSLTKACILYIHPSLALYNLQSEQNRPRSACTNVQSDLGQCCSVNSISGFFLVPGISLEHPLTWLLYLIHLLSISWVSNFFASSFILFLLEVNIYNPCLSRWARKPALCTCKQQRTRPACPFIQSHQGLCCLLHKVKYLMSPQIKPCHYPVKTHRLIFLSLFSYSTGLFSPAPFINK